MKKRIIFALAAIIAFGAASFSSEAKGDKTVALPSDKHKVSQTVYLYADKSPVTLNGHSGEQSDSEGNLSRVNEKDARFDLYFPKKSQRTGQMVIVIPGGGYWCVASIYEGAYVAQWLCDRGIAAAVLTYRLPNHHCTVPTEDFEETISYCRAHSAEWGINSIGVMGFSAGGHFASTVATHEKGEYRPDFQILIYPVITMYPGTHRGTHDNLIGKEPSEELLDLYSNEKQVSSTTPPAFIAFSDDDTVVPVAYNAVPYIKALTENGIPATVVSFPTGGHGWGFRLEGQKDRLPEKDRKAFYRQFDAWLKSL